MHSAFPTLSSWRALNFWQTNFSLSFNQGNPLASNSVELSDIVNSWKRFAISNGEVFILSSLKGIVNNFQTTYV